MYVEVYIVYRPNYGGSLYIDFLVFAVIPWTGVWFAVWQGNGFALALQCASNDQPGTGGSAMGICFASTELAFTVCAYAAGQQTPVAQITNFVVVMGISLASSLVMGFLDQSGELNARKAHRTSEARVDEAVDVRYGTTSGPPPAASCPGVLPAPLHASI
jgi:hypothetical protein